MDPEFQRVLFRVLLLGGAIMVIGAGVLVVAFRAFAPSQSREHDSRAALLLGALIFFVLMMCALLLRLSMVK